MLEYFKKLDLFYVDYVVKVLFGIPFFVKVLREDCVQVFGVKHTQCACV